MISLQEALQQKRDNIDLIPRQKSQRAELFCELYNYYEKDYKRQSWKSYVQWLKQNKFKHSTAKIDEYKKIAFPKISVKSFCSYWLSHIKTEDLWYLISIAKDHDHRGTSFNKWLFFSLKVKDDSQSTV
mgnify:CR=1 FL=1